MHLERDGLIREKGAGHSGLADRDRSLNTDS
jgi:hypothetical protein